MTEQPCHTGPAAHVCGACAEPAPPDGYCLCEPGTCADGCPHQTRGCWMTEYIRQQRAAHAEART